MTTAPNWTHPATPVRVIDGDTIIVRLDLGKYPHRLEVEAPIRIAGLYCPELDEPGGPGARLELVNLAGLGPGDAVADGVVTTLKPDPRDPYGRIVGHVTLNGVDVAEHMIGAGHGAARPHA